MIFTVIYPFWTVWFMNKHWKEIHEGDEEFEEKYGALWEGLKVKGEKVEEGKEEEGSRSVFLYSFFFLFRRFSLGILTVVWQDTLFY
jgi:hypothetical protein